MAANALLDRGYGKPAQSLTGDPEKPNNVAVVDAFTPRIADSGTDAFDVEVRRFEREGCLVSRCLYVDYNRLGRRRALQPRCPDPGPDE
jgi:hypothetical protein